MVQVQPIGQEDSTWDPPASYGVTRRERAGRGRTYRSAVPAQIADLPLSIPAGLAADAEDASPEKIAEMQRTLLARHSLKTVGWRDEPVWIGGGSSTP